MQARTQDMETATMQSTNAMVIHFIELQTVMQVLKSDTMKHNAYMTATCTHGEVHLSSRDEQMETNWKSNNADVR